jgi:sugar-specific transcriptional regulator TrmB
MKIKSNYHDIFELLSKLNISEIEIKIYLALLRQNPVTISQLSRLTNTASTTVFDNAEKLIKKGLVSRIVIGKRNKFIPEDPNKIAMLATENEVVIKRELNKIQNIQKKLPDVIEFINSDVFKTQKANDVVVKFYKGKREVKLLYRDILKAKKIRAYVDTSKLDKIFPENAELFIKAHNSRKDMMIWEIMDNCPVHDPYIQGMDKTRHFYKQIPVELSIPDYLIYDGKVAIIEIRDSIVNGILIKSDNFYRSSKTLFVLMWKILG